MAQHNLTNSMAGFHIIDKRQSTTGATSPLSATSTTAERDNAAIDTQLATLNAGYWTQVRLDRTCQSDKVKALLDGYDAAGKS